MDPTTQQQAVIDSRELEILVEAGAGSGKTTTTVKRYTRLISDPVKPLEPREILAFTFTDKAAGELREKVRKARRKLAEESSAGNPQSFSMSTAWVGTFHAICTRILKAYPVEAGVDPGFTVIDDVTGETVRSESFSLALAEFQREDKSGGRREEMVGLFTERSIRETVQATYDELRSRGIYKPRLPGFVDAEYPTEAIDSLRLQVQRVAAEPKLTANQTRLATRLEKVLIDGGGGRISLADLASGYFYSKREECVGFCDELKQAIAELAAHEEGDFARRSLDRLLELFGVRFEAMKASRSVLDYEDLQLKTLGLLRSHTRIRDAYRDRFKEIMVDEFQDTNQLQLDLVKALRGPKTTLMTVGDEMQSIYGFRHADVELFRARRTEDGVVTYKLTDNFRSQPEVIAAINEIGLRLDEQVKAKRAVNGAATRHEFASLTVGRSDPDQAASATAMITGRSRWKPLDLGVLAPAIPPEAEVGKDEDHFNEAEALGLAHHLRRLVDCGVARQGEIAILLRAKTRTDLYVNALKQVGLSPYLTGGKGFWKSREAVDVRSLLSVIANPLEDDTLLGALTSPACGLSTDALWLLRRAAPNYSPLWPTLELLAGGELPEETNPESREAFAAIPEIDAGRAKDFVGAIKGLREQAGLIPLDALVDEAVTSTGYDLSNLIRDNSKNGMANIRRVASLAHGYEVAEGRDLRGFLDWIALSADLNKESSAATQEEDSDVIRIMTVHAAKGLEFKVACIPDCGRANVNRHDLALRLGKSRPNTDPMDFKVGLRLPRIDGEKLTIYDWDELAGESALHNEDEELRLFHVALTRAEDHLIVSGVLPEKELPKTVSNSQAMIIRFARTFSIDPLAPESWPEQVPDESEPDAEIDLVENFASSEQARILGEDLPSLEAGIPLTHGTPPLYRPDSPVFPNIPLSFTALNEFEECPARFYAKRVLRLEDPAEGGAGFTEGDPELESLTRRDRATAFGSAVHDVFESMGKNRWPELQQEKVARALTDRGVDEETNLELAVEMIRAYLDTDLARMVKTGDAGFEVPLLIRVGKVTIRGFADVILNSRPPLVLDYKTNWLGDKTPADKMSDYLQQRNLYALAVARSGGFDEVETAFVFLGKPDQPVMETLNSSDLAQAESELNRALEDITTGRFFGGPDSDRSPCGKCWACEKLERQIDRASAGSVSAA